MLVIKIVSTPTGEAPEEIREAWIDLELPLDLRNPLAFGAEIISGEPGGFGYVVDMAQAIEELAKHRPDAAPWWYANFDDVQPAERFVFNPECVELEVKDEPTSSTTFRQFVETLDNLGESQYEIWLGNAREEVGEKIWEQLCRCFLSRSLAFLLVRILKEQIGESIARTFSEELYNQRVDRGHGFLKTIAALLIERGVEVEEKEINIPLTLTELAVKAGLLSIDDRGYVHPKKS